MSIKIENVNYIYMKDGPFEKKALKNINLEIKDGELLAVIGHTGSGKSTLIQHLNGLLKPSSGKIYVDGIDLSDKKTKLSQIRQKVGVVFQYPEYQLFEETVEKDIGYGPLNMKRSEEEIKKRVYESAKKVGLDIEKFKDKSPFELSGGEKRRVAIAGILAMNPTTLVLDEPIAGLDPIGRRFILNKIKELNESGITVVLVTHSMEDVAEIASRIVVLSKGEIVLNDVPKKVFKEIDLLEKIGLAAPRVSYLTRELNKRGFHIDEELFTVEEVTKAIEKELRSEVE